jgi:ribosomal protein L40E
MLSTRPNQTRLTPTLDEQSFQGLLAAAFTIQEHNDQVRNDQVKKARLAQSPVQLELLPELSSEPDASSVCPHCGASKPDEELRCPSCGLEPLRPGERLQRNWASMWMMSQEQGSWLERPPDFGDSIRKVHAESEQEKTFAKHKSEEAPSADAASLDLKTEDPKTEELAPEECNLIVQSLPDEHLLEGGFVENGDASPSDAAPESATHFADWRVRLQFHRADLYLTLAVIVAVVALLWPAVGTVRHRALRPWQRALIMLGIADAPTPTVHLQGDPGIQVWIDSHTALYYCPGEEQYGKTADGRFSTQRDAQMESFEPASRSACE